MMVFKQERLTTNNMNILKREPKDVKRAFVQADDLDDAPLEKETEVEKKVRKAAEKEEKKVAKAEAKAKEKAEKEAKK